jgi:FixJ family two-component response regulator
MKVVCVVDDELSLRKGIANLLRSAGYEPVCFDSGESFLASGWKLHADCLLLDLRLRGMQGLEVQQALQQQGCPLPVICMSAHADNQAIAQSLQAGALHFVSKPFNADTLLQAIARILQD